MQPFAERFFIRPSLRAACIAACLLTCTCVFALPLLVPVAARPQISASYIAGFNNHVAVIAAAIISVLATLWHLRRHQLSSPAINSNATFTHEFLPVSLIALLLIITCTFTVTSGWAIHHAGQRYLADAGYFIEQVRQHGVFGGKLYSQLEFAYGPFLFYPTVWLQNLLHCGAFAAYFVTLTIEQAIGLLELAYVLNALPMDRSFRKLAFVLFAFGALNPLFGLNYTLFRYLSPLVCLLVAMRMQQPWPIGLTLLAGQSLSFGISAELGLAFGVSASVMLLWKQKIFTLRTIVGFLGVVVGTVIFCTTIGRGYLHMLGAFAGGALNLPVSPYPHLVVFLFAVCWLAPMSAARSLAQTKSSDGVIASFAYGIGLLPSALGRCDPIHVFFNGLPIFLVSLPALRNATRQQRRLWGACIVILVCWQLAVTNKVFRFRTADTIAAVLPEVVSTTLSRLVGQETALGQHLDPGDIPDYAPDPLQIRQLIGRSTVATPFEITPDLEDTLQQNHLLRRSYYAYMVDTFSASAEQNAIRNLNTNDWALVPQSHDLPFNETPENLQDLQGFSFHLPPRHAVPFLPGDAMQKNLQNNWTSVATLGPYVLLRHTSAM